MKRGRHSPLFIVLANRRLTQMVTAFGAVTIAEWAYVTALSVVAFRQSGTLAVGLVGLRLFVSAASSFGATVLIQRLRPARLVAEVAGIRAVLVLASTAVAASGGSLGVLLGLLGLDALVSAFYRPAQAALAPGFSRNPTELVASVVGLSTVKTLSQAAGAALGGALLSVTTPEVVFGGAGAFFLIALVLVLPFDERGTLGVSAGRPVGIRRLARETATLVKNPHITTILMLSGLRTFVRGMWIVIAVIASLRLLHSGTTGVGLLMLAGGVGSLIAAPLSAWMITRGPIGTPAAISLVACGLPLAVIAGIPLFGVALGLIAVWGVGMAVADVATSSLLNRLLDVPTLPRVTSAIEATKLALEGMGGFLAPVLITAVGVRATLLVASVPLPLMVVRGWHKLHRVDASASERADLLTRLHSIACLEPLNIATLDVLVGRFRSEDIPAAGIDVVRQGDEGARFYIIESGRADVLVDGFLVGVLGPGDSFGERALLRDVPRTATVRARDPMKLLVLGRNDFLEAIVGDPVRSDGSDLHHVVGGPQGISHRDRARVLSRLPLFSHLGPVEVEELTRATSVDHWPPLSRIISSGEAGDHFFVLLEGRAEVMVDGVVVNELRAGDQFGEIALLHVVPRTVDVVTSGPAVTMSLHRRDFLPSIRSRLLAG